MVDVDRMRKEHDKTQKGGDFISFDTGDTMVYVHPECREAEDKWPPTAGCSFIPVVVHYGAGGGKNMVVSLDPETNPIIAHPFVAANLKKKKIKLTGKCPMKKALADGSIEGEAADDQRGQTRYLFGMTPLKYRRKATDTWSDLSGQPGVAFVGKQILDGIMACYYDNGDISDPTAAYLLRITKEGKDRLTKYSVKAEPATLKKPFVLPKALASKIAKATAENGDCDLFRIVSNMVKSPAEIAAMLAGVSVSTEPDDDDEGDEEEDDEAELPKPKKKAAAPPAEDEEEEEADEEEEEEAPPPKKLKKKVAPPPEEEEEEADDEEEEEQAPPPKKKAKVAPPPDDDDEEPPAPPPKLKKKVAPPPEEEEEEAPKPKKKVKAPVDDDELELADLEAQLENLEEEDEEEEEAPPPKKKAKAAPPPEEEEEEELAPPKKLKKKT